MATIIKLTDHIDLYASNMGVGGALTIVADALPKEADDLARWLRDKSDRTAPFMDFDMRGLSPHHRRLVWQAVEETYLRFKDRDLDTTFSPSVGVLRQLQDLRAEVEADETANAQADPIDLTELWG